MSVAHGPNRLRNYLGIHSTCLERFRSEGFAGPDDLQITRTECDVVMQGSIGCLGRIVITVEKYLEILEDGPDPLVQTYKYAYNVSVQGAGNVFRYDNAHGRKSGEPFERQRTHWHHKHDYEFPPTEGQDPAGTMKWLSAEQWPHLSDVIEEARSWYWENYESLEKPLDHPDLALCRSFEPEPS